MNKIVKYIFLILIIAATSLQLQSCRKELTPNSLRWNRYTLECKTSYGQTVTRVFDLPSNTSFFTVLTFNRYTLNCSSPNTGVLENTERPIIAYDIIDFKIVSIDSSKNFVHEIAK